jgi:hypothetical protein
MHLARSIEVYRPLPNCGPSVWKLLHLTPPMPVVCRRLLDFWAPALRTSFYYSVPALALVVAAALFSCSVVCL